MERTLTCIGCPMGCQITVRLESNEIESVTGNTCRHGEIYARSEVTAPVRTITGTIRVIGGESPVVSVKTASDIPKARIGNVARALKEVSVCAPVAAGQVLIEDVCGTGADIVATKSVAKAWEMS